MLKIFRIAATFAALSLSSIAAAPTHAADIRLLHPGVLIGFIEATIPEFEGSSGHKVTTLAGTGGALTERIQKGETADVLIAAAAQIKELADQGKVVAGTQVGVARLGMGIAVRKGGPKPDISSVDALRRALAAAKSVGYADPALGAPSGVHAEKVIADLGLAAELKPKIKMYESGPLLVAAMAKGEVELGFAPMTEIAAEPNIEAAGSLPAQVQSFTQLAGGIVAASQQVDAGKALLGFLTSAATRSALAARGFDAP